MEGSGCVPCGGVACLAREGDSWDLSRLCRICSGANGTGEGYLNSDVASDIRSGKGEFGLCTVPELGSSDIDALLDGGDWE